MRSRLKLPNGFGSVVEYKDKRRRKPFIAKKFVNGKQIAVGSFATYEEALCFLVDYNRSETRIVEHVPVPASPKPKCKTFSEVYELVRAERFPKIAKATALNYEAGYKHCKDLYDMPMDEISAGDLQKVISLMSSKGIGYPSQKKTRQLMHHCYSYAIKYNILPPSSDVAGYVELDKHVKVYPKLPFEPKEVAKVKALADSEHKLSKWAKCVVMMCYIGTRPSEFLAIATEDFHAKQRYFTVRESKTEAGRNRIVPINKAVIEYFKEFAANGHATLIADDEGKKLSYHAFRDKFDRVMKHCGLKHTPHECRHTCATWLDNAKANKVSIMRILGHSPQGITDGVYIHKSLEELRKAIDLVK